MVNILHKISRHLCCTYMSRWCWLEGHPAIITPVLITVTGEELHDLINRINQVSKSMIYANQCGQNKDNSNKRTILQSFYW